MKATHSKGRWHLSQGVFGLVGQGLSAQQLPDGLRRGQQVDQGQKGLEKRETLDLKERGAKGASDSVWL